MDPSSPPPPDPTTTISPLRSPSPTDPLNSPQPHHSLTLHTHDLTSLLSLASRGAWRTIVDKVTRARSLPGLLKSPHEHLVYLAFNSLALSKLRRFSDSLRDLDSLDDLDSSAYRYESYPHIYEDSVSGSFVPFLLRWLRCQIPAKLGKKQETIDRLYELLGFVRGRIAGGDAVGVWKRREEFVMGSIIGHHLGQKEFLLCVDLIRDMISRDVENVWLWSKLGYVQMQFGDLESANASFNRIESIILSRERDGDDVGVRMRNLVSRNTALMYMVEKDYVSAVREYEVCIERDGTDVVAINNKALCLMYLRDLSDSIKVLESALERVPTVALNETLVVNLCSMYELAHVNHTDIKRTLSTWIAQVAPDDFDASCTRV